MQLALLQFYYIGGRLSSRKRDGFVPEPALLQISEKRCILKPTGSTPVSLMKNILEVLA